MVARVGVVMAVRLLRRVRIVMMLVRMLPS